MCSIVEKFIMLITVQSRTINRPVCQRFSDMISGTTEKIMMSRRFNPRRTKRKPMLWNLTTSLFLRPTVRRKMNAPNHLMYRSPRITLAVQRFNLE
jgi:hypothetical protein